MKKYLLSLLLLLPIAAMAIDQIDISANTVLASHKSMKPDARHAAVAIALVDKAGNVLSLDANAPLDTNQVMLTGTAIKNIIRSSSTLPSGLTIPAPTLILTGTAHPAGSLVVSGSTLKLYLTGSTGVTFSGSAF